MASAFLLGIGCQKGGTTWLHRYLSNHPNVNLGFTKEYHFFDALYSVSRDKIVEAAQMKTRDFYLVHGDAAHGDEVREQLLHFYSSPSAYFDYFSTLLKNNGTEVVGDITPEYALLSLEAMRKVKRLFDEFNIRPKVLFIMRDPVERIWSAVRMHRVIYPHKFSPTDPRTDADLVHSRYLRKDIEIRTRYDQTIKVIEAVFDKDQIHYEFFEKLHTPNAIRNITEFLGIPYTPPALAQKINNTKKQTPLSAETISLIRTHYQETYDFVLKKFKSQNIEQYWLR